MTVLRATGACFALDAADLVTPFSLVLEAGGRADVGQPTARAASIAARMCAAIVKPTQGTVYVGEYETRLQPPQAKRRVGFVDAGGFAGDAHAFRCEVAFHADVWGIPADAAQARAAELVGRFVQAGAADLDVAYARALALALVADVSLVVLDQPLPRFEAAARRIVPLAGLLVTHVTLARPALAAATLAPVAT